MPKRETANLSHFWWPFIYCLSLGLGKCSPQQLWGNSNLCTANAPRYLCTKAAFIKVHDSLLRILALHKDLHCNNSNSTNPWWIGSLQVVKEQLPGIQVKLGAWKTGITRHWKSIVRRKSQKMGNGHFLKNSPGHIWRARDSWIGRIVWPSCLSGPARVMAYWSQQALKNNC